MKTAIISLQRAGKTSLFKILTGVSSKSRIGTANVRHGIVNVSDDRLDIFQPVRVRPATVGVEGTLWHLPPCPLHEFLRLGTHEEFIAHPVYAIDPPGLMMMKQAIPEAWADVEQVIQVPRRDEDIRVDQVDLIHAHGRLNPSRLANS